MVKIRGWEILGKGRKEVLKVGGGGRGRRRDLNRGDCLGRLPSPLLYSLET